MCYALINLPCTVHMWSVLVELIWNPSCHLRVQVALESHETLEVGHLLESAQKMQANADAMVSLFTESHCDCSGSATIAVSRFC